MTLHILSNGWWVPEDIGQSITGRVVHVNHEPKVPKGRQGTKEGRTVVLRCYGGTVNVWAIQGQVVNPGLIRVGNYITFTCAVPDQGYSDERHYVVSRGRHSEMTDLNEEKDDWLDWEEPKLVDRNLPRAIKIQEYPPITRDQLGPHEQPEIIFARMFTHAALSGLLGEPAKHACTVYGDLLSVDLEAVLEKVAG